MWLRLEQVYKSLTPFGTIDLPDLVVLSGENGAGKSHLLQGIAETRIAGDWGVDANRIRMLTSEQLGNPPELGAGGEGREQIVARFEQAFVGLRTLRDHPQYRDPAALQQAVDGHLQNLGLSRLRIAELEARVGKPILEWDHDDFVFHTPAEIGDGDLFAVAVGDIFGRYNQLVTGNDLEALRESRGQPHGIVRSGEEIREMFGGPPWDLLNTALDSVGLQYRFSAPELSLLPLAAPPALRHVITGESYPVSALSSGEKTLLSVALSVYSAGNRKDYLKLPAIVLLDEPDATLHPSMIRSLLQMLKDQFVGDLGIRVLMTTHSPTTVALAPEESLYVMNKWGEPRLEPATSKDAALSNLLVGVPTVSVSAEHRRIVVVESPHDERRYTKIVTLLTDHLSSERSLVFMAAGSTSLPSGSAAVIDLVNRLRQNGNRSVWGLIDRDTRTSQPSDYVLFDATRYTTENIVLDPLSVGLFLLLESFGPAVSALSGIDYVNFQPETHAQLVVDYVVGAVGSNGGSADPVETLYVGGFTAQVPRFWLDEPGHDLAKRLPSGLQLLGKYEHDSERLLGQIIDRVWTSRPGLIPQSTLHVMSQLLSTAQ